MMRGEIFHQFQPIVKRKPLLKGVISFFALTLAVALRRFIIFNRA